MDPNSATITIYIDDLTPDDVWKMGYLWTLQGRLPDEVLLDALRFYLDHLFVEEVSE